MVGLGLGRMRLRCTLHWDLDLPGVAPPTRSFQGVNILHQPPLLLILSGLGTFISTRHATSPRSTTPDRRNRRRRRRLHRNNSSTCSTRFILSGLSHGN